jgi:hypothetical protein
MIMRLDHTTTLASTSEMQYALGQDATENGACPDGLSEGMRRDGMPGYGANTAAGGRAPPSHQRNGAAPPAGAQRPQAAGNDDAERQFIRSIMDPSRPNACLNPEKFEPDPKFRTVKVEGIKAYGIDIDGRDSRQQGQARPGTCTHSDFLGMQGERGIDNQFYRLVGCSQAYQSTGPGNTWTIEMHTGAWGVLIALAGVDSGFRGRCEDSERQ